MAGKTAILAIRIISDATKAAKGFQQTETAAQKMERRMSKASTIAAGGLGLVAAGAIVAGKAAADDAQQQAVLARSLTNAAGASSKQVAATEAWIDAQARATGIADDQLRPALGNLVRATGDVAKSQDALKIAMDVSAATGKSVETVSAAMAKGYGGQTTALGRLVPGMDQAILKSGDMNKITAELARTTGGTAAAAADTQAGKMQRAKLAMDETVESIGGFLLPMMGRLADQTLRVIGFVDRHQKAVVILTAVLAAAAGAVIGINTAVKVYRATTAAITAATKAWAIAQKVLNISMFANPIGLVVLAVVALIAGFVLAYKKSETFRRIVDAAGRAGRDAIGWIVDKTQALIDKVRGIIDWIGRIRWPKPPAWMLKVGKGIGDLFGGGKGGPGPRGPSDEGRGGPGDGPGWGPRAAGGGGVTINLYGVIDPVTGARKIREIMSRDDVRFAR